MTSLRYLLVSLPTFTHAIIQRPPHPGPAAAKSLQSCPTLCNPIDGSLPGSAVPGVLQARTLEWVAISFSNAWEWKVKVKSLSRVRLFAIPWTAAYQAPPSMGFSKQGYWSEVPLPSPHLILTLSKRVPHFTLSLLLFFTFPHSTITPSLNILALPIRIHFPPFHPALCPAVDFND